MEHDRLRRGRRQSRLGAWPGLRACLLVPALRNAWISLSVAAISPVSAALAAEQAVTAQLKAAVLTACIDYGRESTAIGGAIQLAIEPLKIQGREVGTRTDYEFRDGARIYVERFAPGGSPRRVVVVYHAPAERARRPEWMVFADSECRIVAGRHLVYDGSGAPAFIEGTDASLT
ncbi:MAG: hypothetical protein ACREUB_08635, partial [Burkholderiales bacterium]